MANYRGINPKLSFDGPSHPLMLQQFNWNSTSDKSSSALFAGQIITISKTDDDETFQMDYLNFAHPIRFESIDEAKAEASSFARAVLLRMIEYVGILEDDVSLRNCLDCSGQ